jgi:solute carrier family 13 (sodium-dependent dicarboxylate transporter), member 2/3/5
MKQSKINHSRFVSQILCVLVPLMFWFAPLPMEPITKHALAVALFMLLAWITQAADHAVAGLVGCFLFWALGIVHFDVAFSGFATNTAWFSFGAILIGAAASKSGLARRLAYQVMLRVGTSYSRILLGLIVTSLLLTVAVPSGVARVVIMAAISLGLVEALGPQFAVSGGRGIFLIITYAAALFDKMIIAGTSAITARGLMAQVGDVDVQWSQWFLAFLPCDIITVIAAWLLTLWLFPAEKLESEDGLTYLQSELRKLGPLSAVETKAAILIGSATVLWMTDFIHHVSPAKIGLGVGLAALLPYVGILRIEDLKNINFLSFFFVAAALGMAKVLAVTNGLDLLTNFIFSWLQAFTNGGLTSIIALYWTAFVYHILLSSDIAMLGTSIPVLMTFAKMHNLNAVALGMIWTFASAGKIFVYQSAVLIVGYSFGYFKARDLLYLGLLLTFIEFVAILIVVQTYWPMIGIEWHGTS